MKWFLFCFSVLAFSLAGCQYLPSSYRSKEPLPPPEPKVNELEQAVIYGANFASEYEKNPKATCRKYQKLYHEGDLSAGWVLALHVDASNVQYCLKSKEALLILKKLESDKNFNSELIWIGRYHVRLIKKLQQATKKISKLKRATRKQKQQVTELQQLNQEQLEKLQALKAIATSINND